MVGFTIGALVFWTGCGIATGFGGSQKTSLLRKIITLPFSLPLIISGSVLSLASSLFYGLTKAVLYPINLVIQKIVIPYLANVATSLLFISGILLLAHLVLSRLRGRRSTNSPQPLPNNSNPSSTAGMGALYDCRRSQNLDNPAIDDVDASIGAVRSSFADYGDDSRYDSTITANSGVAGVPSMSSGFRRWQADIQSPAGVMSSASRYTPQTGAAREAVSTIMANFHTAAEEVMANMSTPHTPQTGAVEVETVEVEIVSASGLASSST